MKNLRFGDANYTVCKRKANFLAKYFMEGTDFITDYISKERL
jgi:hypothetical protein